MPLHRLPRRDFLGGAGVTGIPLIGTALVAGKSRPAQVVALKDTAKSVAVHPYGGLQHQELEQDG